MKTVYKFLYFSILISFLFAGYRFHSTTSSSSIKKLTKSDRIDEAVTMEVQLTKDLSLDCVPKNRLAQANEITSTYKYSAQNRRRSAIQWNEKGPINVGGRTRTIIFDKADLTGETILAGSASGGVWRGSHIFSQKPFWTNITPDQSNLAIGALAQDPIDPLIIYAGTGEGWFNGDAVRGIGILKSLDGGTTWSRLQSTNNNHFNYVQKIVIDRLGHLYACTRDNGVMKSQNQGEHWTKVLGSGEHAFSDRAADIEIAADGTLFASLGIFSSDGIYRSDDDGVTWRFVHQNGLPTVDFRRIDIAVAPSNANIVYAILENNIGGCRGIYKSENKGHSWTSLAIPTSETGLVFGRNQLWYDMTISVNEHDANRLIVGGVNLFQSINGGSSWVQLSNWFETSQNPFVHADQHQILYHSEDGTRALFANDGGIFACNNLNTSKPQFIHVVTDYNVTQFYSCAIHPTNADIIAGGSQDNGCLVIPNKFTSNAITISRGDGGHVHYAGDQGEYLITSFPNNNYNVYLHNDLIGELSFSGGSFVNPTAMIDNQFYGNVGEGKFFRINLNDNLTEELVFVSELSNASIRHLKASPNVSNRLYLGLSDGRVIYVNDVHEGSTKSGVEIMNKTGSVSSIAIEKGNENHLIVTISNYGETSVWESTDGGTHWLDAETNLPDMPIRWAVFAPGRAEEVLLATETGVWRTDSIQGSSTIWYPEPEFPNARTDMIKIHEQSARVLVATHGRGLFTTDYYSQFVHASNSPSSQAQFTIYPNPAFQELKFDSSLSGKYFVHSLEGKLQLAGMLENSASLDIRELTKGSYIFSLKNKKKFDSKRFVKL